MHMDATYMNMASSCLCQMNPTRACDLHLQCRHLTCHTPHRSRPSPSQPHGRHHVYTSPSIQTSHIHNPSTAPQSSPGHPIATSPASRMEIPLLHLHLRQPRSTPQAHFRTGGLVFYILQVVANPRHANTTFNSFQSIGGRK